jgi:hypothetical protein
MRQDVVDRQVRAMKEARLDAIVSCSPENFAYVTGFMSPTQPLMRWRHAMAVVTADGKVALVVVDMEASTIRDRAGEGSDIAAWREFRFDAMAVLADVLKRHGLAAARIGVELDYLPAADFADLGGLLPQAQFVPAQALLARLRQIKTPHEIEILRRLSRIADRAIVEAFGAVAAGATEMDLAAALTRGVYKQGAEYFKLMIVATGERSVFPNVGPTARVLRRGDICRVEIFPDDRRLSRRGLPHRGRRGAAAGSRAHLGQPHGLQIHAAQCHQAGRVEPGDIRSLSEQDRRTEPAAHRVHRPRHRAAPARRPLSRPRRPAARSRHGARHRTPDLTDRLRVRHAEQGYGAGDRTGLRTVVGSCGYRQVDYREMMRL